MVEYIVEAETLDELIDGRYAVCDTFYGMTDQNGFCHMAERREDD